MSNNVDTLLIGVGKMALEHYKVLKALNKNVLAIGRGKKSAKYFEQQTGLQVLCGEIEEVVLTLESVPQYAIVAVNVEQLKNVTIKLMKIGIKNILIEKPAGINFAEIKEIKELNDRMNLNIYVGYNRRFYSSVEKAIEIIRDDGGVSSFNFEFTEWAHTIEALDKPMEVKKAWLFANSTHVIDLAFFLGGKPKEISAYSNGKLSWHEKSNFCGAGITEKGVLFNYCANWNAPGRWGIEILTQYHRLVFKPLEVLKLQKKKSIEINQVKIKDDFDIKYKPGIYRMLNCFYCAPYDDRLITIEEHYENALYYEVIMRGNVS